MDWGTGQLLTFQTTSDKIDDLQDYLDFLPETELNTALLRRLGINGKNGKMAHSNKTEWRQTQLRTRQEVITLADGVATTVTVADSGVYQVGELLRCENEIMRVTALPSATTLTVTRAYSGTTGVAHSAKLMYTLGKAATENGTPGSAIFDTPAELFNYVQTFDVSVEVSMDQMMTSTVDGNTLDQQLERRFIEINRELARAFIYGKKYRDTTNKIHAMGGILEFITTNVTNVAGALTVASIDAQILNIVNAGGKPTIIAMSAYQKQKLDALDANKQYLGKRENTGGNLITKTWQSGVLPYELDVVVDNTILTDQLLILDEEQVEIMPFGGNGESGAWGTYEATTPGQDGKKKIIRGKYTQKTHNEKAHGYLYGLS